MSPGVEFFLHARCAKGNGAREEERLPSRKEMCAVAFGMESSLFLFFRSSLIKQL